MIKPFVKINEPRVKDYYYINENGEIISYYNPNKPIKLKYRIDKDGYYTVSLQLKDGRRVSFRVSRLVALTFLENKNNYPVVNHKDCNKQNNHVSNLEWVTISYNTKHAYDNGLIKHGRIRKVKAINLITKEEKIFDSMKETCEYFDYDVSSISKMCSGKLKPYKRGKIANIKFEYYEEKPQTTIETTA